MSVCIDGTSKLSAPSLVCSAAGEELVDVFNELRVELVRRLFGILGNYDEAEDVAQETFLKCWRNRNGVGQVRNLRAWIFQIGRNAGKDLLRSAWRRRRRPLVGPSTLALAPAACPVKNTLEREASERLRRAILNLRPKDREVFLLRQTGGLTYEEIATRLCIPVGTVKTRMRSAAAKLRQVLREMSGGEW
jgi:RNA polymerase sigma-70 factor, ECF subfamily